MLLMYVDESGDTGSITKPQASKHYCLSGIIIDSAKWKNIFDNYIQFRKSLKSLYGMNIRTELHASEFIRPRSSEYRQIINKNSRIGMLKYIVQRIPNIFEQCKVINVFLNKANFGKDVDFFSLGWGRMIQRFSNHIQLDYIKNDIAIEGLIITDDTNQPKLTGLLRKMRAFNFVPFSGGYDSRKLLCKQIIEDPWFKNSKHSYFVQIADIIVYCLFKKELISHSLKRYNLHKFFLYLEPILLKSASKNDPHGIVRK